MVVCPVNIVSGKIRLATVIIHILFLFFANEHEITGWLLFLTLPQNFTEDLQPQI